MATARFKTSAQIFSQLFVNRRDVYCYQWITPAGKLSYGTNYSALTDELINQHLSGEMTLGVTTVDEHGLCKFCMWDNDKDIPYLEDIESILKSLKLNPLREARRLGREGHLWLFFDKLIAVDRLYHFMKEIIHHGGIPYDERTRKDAVEHYPAEDRKRDKRGTIVRAPFGIHLKPGANRQVSLFEACPAKSVDDQLLWLDAQPRSDSSVVERIGAAVQKVTTQTRKHRTKSARWNGKSKDLDDDELIDLLDHLGLNPEDKGEWLDTDCPECLERRAFIYKDAQVLICNRKDSCGYSASVQNLK